MLGVLRVRSLGFMDPPPFLAVTSTVKQALQESLVQILQPQRRVDMLRDIMDAQRHQRPYVVTFCGVNGVGKSTNLAKVSRAPHFLHSPCLSNSHSR